MDSIVHGVTKSQTRLSDFHTRMRAHAHVVTYTSCVCTCVCMGVCAHSCVHTWSPDCLPQAPSPVEGEAGHHSHALGWPLGVRELVRPSNL